jgi:hypothetical protein
MREVDVIASQGSQSRPVPGPDFKPGVRYFVSRVGSTPTGFRHINLFIIINLNGIIAIKESRSEILYGAENR